MFKRKKKEDEEPKEEPEKPTEIIETDAKDEAKATPEVKEEVKLTPEQEKMVELITEFREKYGGIFTYNDFAQIRLEPTLCNLLLATYIEIKGLREDIAEINK